MAMVGKNMGLVNVQRDRVRYYEIIYDFFK